MKDHRFSKDALSDWMKGEGPDSDIVISSRVRIARNLQKLPFPMLATNDQARDALNQLLSVRENGLLEQIGEFDAIELTELTELDRRVLVEKHLISPGLANDSRFGAVILSENEAISIMVNEEDHLRIQCLYPGFQVQEAWRLADHIDNIFESEVDFAYDERLGYLTTCPTNVGTGIRASVMMHLPALVLTQQINRILSAVTKVGLAVRGLYGEGSEAQGNFFQISNQITLGQSESEIIENLHNVAKQIVAHERAARTRLMQESRLKMEDRVRRSFGILSYAAVMDSKEASQRLSDVRLGADLGILKGIKPHMLNELTVMTQPGFLQKTFDEAMSPEQRDYRRAELIRNKISGEAEHGGA